jgi:hypothetical protein
MSRDSELMTRRELAEYLGKCGRPISFHTLNQLCARGEGPPHAGVWRGQYQYDPDRALAWARSRFRATDLSARGRRRAA